VVKMLGRSHRGLNPVSVDVQAHILVTTMTELAWPLSQCSNGYIEISLHPQKLSSPFVSHANAFLKHRKMPHAVW
jgi:hypothetical protein